MNRAMRRAQSRGKVQIPMVRVGDLTMDEAEILEEALDMYLREQDSFVEGEPTEQQAWVIDRATRIKNALYAAIHGGKWHDQGQERELPRG